MTCMLKGDVTSCVSDIPHIPPVRNLAFYLILLFVVGPFLAVPLVSWAFVIYSLSSGVIWHYTYSKLLLFAVALAETFFSVYYILCVRFVSGPCPIPPGDMRELQVTFSRVLKAGLSVVAGDYVAEKATQAFQLATADEDIERLERDDPRAVDFRSSLRTWFGKVPWSQIHRHEMQMWLYWAIFNSRMPELETMPNSRRKFLDEALQLIEKRSGTTIPEGSNPSAKPILLTLDPVNFAWRPLSWYTFIAIGNWFIMNVFVLHHGMKLVRFDNAEYLLRIPSGWDPHTGPSPVVFIHGLGLGLIQYALFIRSLLSLTTCRPLLVPLQPHTSQLVFHPEFFTPKSRHATATSIHSLFKNLGWVHGNTDIRDTFVHNKPKGLTILSHSNGSFMHAWLLKAFPDLISRSCFVDPVTFCSWEGDVCYNFLYRRPATGIQLLMYYFVGSELGVTNVLQRHFDWSSNSLYFEEIPHARDVSRTIFFLGGQDAILSAARVKKYLSSHGIYEGMIYDPNGQHGSALLDGSPGFKKLSYWLNQLEL